jgi:hypothetical protein
MDVKSCQKGGSFDWARQKGDSMTTINKLGLVLFLIGLVHIQDAESWLYWMYLFIEFVGMFLLLAIPDKRAES